MLASVEKVEGGHIACFKRPLKHSIEKVWVALTTNDKLEKWMPNLQVEDLSSGGIIKFNMNDGTGDSFDIKIKECQVNSVLEYEWGGGWIRFELHPSTDGCMLIVKEFISTINDHTSKDLAGWHVCLDVFNDLLIDHVHAEFPKESWNQWHEKYVTLVSNLLSDK